MAAKQSESAEQQHVPETPDAAPSSGNSRAADQSAQVLLRPKPAFLSILRTVGVKSNVLTRTEILDNLKEYIKEKGLFDPQTPYVIQCEGDELERVFGAKEFNVNRVLSFIFQNTELASGPTTEGSSSQQLDEVDGAPRIKPPDALAAGTTHDTRKNRRRKREGDSPEERRRRRRQRCSSSISIVSSDGEGPSAWAIQVVEIPSPASSDHLSVQSKETVFVKSSSDTLITDTELPVIDWDDEDEDAPFSIEYEVRSTSSGDYDDDDDITSDDESHHGQGILVVCKDSDVEFFADYSESEDDESDPEIASDKWICSACSNLNSPLSRYCLCCWKERPGWLPETHKFRRSLSAPSGVPSAASSPSPTGSGPEMSSLPMDFTVPFAPTVVVSEELLMANSPVVPSTSSQDSLLMTPQSGRSGSSSSSHTNPIHRRLLKSLAGKRSATSVSDSLSNQSFDSAIRSGSQDSEISISITPTSVACTSLLSTTTCPDSQESGRFSESSYSLETTACTMSPEILQPSSKAVDCDVALTAVSSEPKDDVNGPSHSETATNGSGKNMLLPSSTVGAIVTERDTPSEEAVHKMSPFALDTSYDSPGTKIAESSTPHEKLSSGDYDYVDHPLGTKVPEPLIGQEKYGSCVSEPVDQAVISLLDLQKSDSVTTAGVRSGRPDFADDLPTAGVNKRKNNECPFCMKQTSNAVLVHGKTGHQVCCYKCARKLRRRGKPCPVCRNPIQKVIRNFIV